MSRLPGENYKKKSFFFLGGGGGGWLLPFANLDIENLKSQKTLQLGASILVSL